MWLIIYFDILAVTKISSEFPDVAAFHMRMFARLYLCCLWTGQSGDAGSTNLRLIQVLSVVRRDQMSSQLPYTHHCLGHPKTFHKFTPVIFLFPLSICPWPHTTAPSLRLYFMTWFWPPTIFLNSYIPQLLAALLTFTQKYLTKSRVCCSLLFIPFKISVNSFCCKIARSIFIFCTYNSLICTINNSLKPTGKDYFAIIFFH